MALLTRLNSGEEEKVLNEHLALEGVVWMKTSRSPPPPLQPSVSADFPSVRSDSSWLALSNELTQLDWWPGADTDLSPAAGSGGGRGVGGGVVGWWGVSGTTNNGRGCRKYQRRTTRRETIVSSSRTTVHIVPSRFSNCCAINQEWRVRELRCFEFCRYLVSVLGQDGRTGE